MVMSADGTNAASTDRPPGPLRGRPRSPQCDGAILDAAWSLLAETGYTRLSMERIAAAAGVGKPTLYLRYANKAQVVAAAFVRHRLERAPEPTGDLRADIAAQLEHIRQIMDGVGMSLLGTCLVEERHLPDLIDMLREHSLRPGRRILRDLLKGAVTRGELRGAVDADIAVAMAVGSFYALRIAGDGFEPGWAEHVSDATLRMMGPTAAR